MFEIVLGAVFVATIALLINTYISDKKASKYHEENPFSGGGGGDPVGNPTEEDEV